MKLKVRETAKREIKYCLWGHLHKKLITTPGPLPQVLLENQTYLEPSGFIAHFLGRNITFLNSRVPHVLIFNRSK